MPTRLLPANDIDVVNSTSCVGHSHPAVRGQMEVVRGLRHREPRRTAASGTRSRSVDSAAQATLSGGRARSSERARGARDDGGRRRRTKRRRRGVRTGVAAGGVTRIRWCWRRGWWRFRRRCVGWRRRSRHCWWLGLRGTVRRLAPGGAPRSRRCHPAP